MNDKMYDIDWDLLKVTDKEELVQILKGLISLMKEYTKTLAHFSGLKELEFEVELDSLNFGLTTGSFERVIAIGKTLVNEYKRLVNKAIEDVEIKY
jgi:K+/H+ antiporter YhaU regulatory subunit KhtT